MNSPAHADAAIKDLADSGQRCVFAYGYSPIAGFYDKPGAEEARAADLRRVQKQYFASDDPLLTLAVAGRANTAKAVADIKLARELGLRITLHITTPGKIVALDRAGVPDLTYVHTWRTNRPTRNMPSWRRARLDLVAGGCFFLGLLCPEVADHRRAVMGRRVAPSMSSPGSGLETCMPKNLGANASRVLQAPSAHGGR